MSLEYDVHYWAGLSHRAEIGARIISHRREQRAYFGAFPMTRRLRSGLASKLITDDLKLQGFHVDHACPKGECTCYGPLTAHVDADDLLKRVEALEEKVSHLLDDKRNHELMLVALEHAVEELRAEWVTNATLPFMQGGDA